MGACSKGEGCSDDAFKLLCRHFMCTSMANGRLCTCRLKDGSITTHLVYGHDPGISGKSCSAVTLEQPSATSFTFLCIENQARAWVRVK